MGIPFYFPLETESERMMKLEFTLEQNNLWLNKVSSQLTKGILFVTWISMQSAYANESCKAPIPDYSVSIYDFMLQLTAQVCVETFILAVETTP